LTDFAQQVVQEKIIDKWIASSANWCMTYKSHFTASPLGFESLCDQLTPAKCDRPATCYTYRKQWYAKYHWREPVQNNLLTLYELLHYFYQPNPNLQNYQKII